jgi:acyl-ACP thioesterase
MSLPSVLKLLQEGAIQHADCFDMGTSAIDRGETWVLNRLALHLTRYPRYGDDIRLETWSSGIVGFRGYREYRIHCGDELLLSGSSLWLYIHVATKALVRISPERAKTFPASTQPPFLPEIERLPVVAPDRTIATTTAVSVRYSDVDANGHVNNTAYFDFLQSALARTGHCPTPTSLKIKFSKEIPADIAAVDVALETREDATVFSIGNRDATYACGEVSSRR